MEKQKPHAIVVGLDSLSGLSGARVLASRQIPVIAIAKDPKHPHSRTKVCENIIFADSASEELIGTLENLALKLDQKAVLLPCEDWNVLLVSRHRQKLKQWYHFVLPEPDVVEMIFNKTSFYTYAQKEGFPIPRTFFLHNEADAEKTARELTYPCIMKPPGRSKEWEEHTRFKVYKIFSPEELLTCYSNFKKWAQTLIVQEWIEGPDSNLCGCYCYFNANSEPLVTFVARKVRQWPPETGISCLCEECRNDTVLNETLRLFSGLGHRGLGHMEMKRDERTGQHLITEAHVGRPTSRSHIAEAGGVDLLYTMYCDALGWPLPENREQKYIGVKRIHLRRDFQSALHYYRKGELTLKEWVLSLRGIKTYALLSRNDPGPFIGDLLRVIRILLSPSERKKRAD